LAGRPSRWSLAHISSSLSFSAVIVIVVVAFIVINTGCMMVCRRDEDCEHVTLADSESELESGQFAEFEKVMRVCHLRGTCSL